MAASILVRVLGAVAGVMLGLACIAWGIILCFTTPAWGISLIVTGCALFAAGGLLVPEYRNPDPLISAVVRANYGKLKLDELDEILKSPVTCPKCGRLFTPRDAQSASPYGICITCPTCKVQVAGPRGAPPSAADVRAIEEDAWKRGKPRRERDKEHPPQKKKEGRGLRVRWYIRGGEGYRYLVCHFCGHGFETPAPYDGRGRQALGMTLDRQEFENAAAHHGTCPNCGATCSELIDESE